VRQWFNSQELDQTIANGRAIVERELQREGRTGAALDALAAKLGFEKTDEFFAAAGREEIGARQIQIALRGEEPAAAVRRCSPIAARRAAGAEAS